MLDVSNGTATIESPRVLRKIGVPARRALRLVADELIGHDQVVESVMSEPFDVFDPLINQQLKFQLFADDKWGPRATPPFALVGSPLLLQPVVRVLDVNGTLVDDESQVISVQLALEAPSGVAHPLLWWYVNRHSTRSRAFRGRFRWWCSSAVRLRASSRASSTR